MRKLVFVAVAVFAGALPAAAAQLDPSTLVLRQRDVPSGFRLEEKESGVRTNARRVRDTPELKSLFARADRVTGYEATFLRVGPKPLVPHVIESHVDVLRTRTGAVMVLNEFDRQARAQLRKQVRFRQSPVAIGDAGTSYAGKARAPFAFVAWRQGRVFAVVFTLNLSAEQALALARKQERRIATALR